nr:MAG TPA: hypothetical protein [Caudoviricetes sp.]
MYFCRSKYVLTPFPTPTPARTYLTLQRLSACG